MPRPVPLVVLALLLGGCTGTTAPPTPEASHGATADEDVAIATEGAHATPVEDPAPKTVVMWARGGLPAEVATRAARLPGVLAADLVRSDTLALLGSRDADGRPVDQLEPGWRIPVEVVALDPAGAAALADGPARDAVAALRPGEVLLTASAASQRGLQVDDRLDLDGAPGLRVAAIVADAALPGDEVVVHTADADRVGIRAEGTVRMLVDQARDADLADALQALAPEDTAVRVVGAEEGETPRRAPLVLDLPTVKATFGEFAFRDDDADREIMPEAAWVAEHIVVTEVPLLGRVRCHEAIVEDLRGALQAVADAGFGSTFDRRSYAGCYYPRRIGSGPSLSRHSWGIAIDLNVDVTQPGLGPVPAPEVVDAFAAHGFRWGGLFLQPDNHHFEWVGAAALEPPPERREGGR